jgi:beta-galactosidase
MVKVWKNGKPWAKDTRVTTGTAKTVKASVDRKQIGNDGHDLAYIALSTVDAKGKVVPTDCRRVSFRISGPAELVGFCNGNQTDQTSMVSKEQKFFNGRIVAVVRGKRGKNGKAVVQVNADNLPKVSVPITVGEGEESETED